MNTDELEREDRRDRLVWQSGVMFQTLRHLAREMRRDVGSLSDELQEHPCSQGILAAAERYEELARDLDWNAHARQK